VAVAAARVESPTRGESPRPCTPNIAGVKVDAFISSVRGAAQDARRARTVGYDGLWSAELDHDPFLPLGRAAEASYPLELGTSIAVAFARSPMTLAATAWDLQALSEGRFILGIGSQVRAHIERRFSMPWSRPAARMREFICAMRAIWTAWQEGTPLDFRGDFYTHTLMTPNFDPGPLPCGPPRVMLAAVGAAMTSVAAEVADGVLLHAFTTRRYIREVTLPTLRQALDRSGRARAQFEVKYAPFIASGADEGELEQSISELRRRIAFYASTPTYRPVLELHGWGGLQAELNDLARQGRWDDMGALVDDEVLEAFAVIALRSQLPSALGRWVKGLADRVSVSLPTPQSSEEESAMIAELRQAAGDGDG